MKIAEDSWKKHHKSGSVQYFMAFKKNRPVAVSALTTFKGIGYISNVGSLQEVRGQGFGKLVTLFAVSQSKNKGNTYHCLLTEEGRYPYEFYKRIGFESKFIVIAYSKNK